MTTPTPFAQYQLNAAGGQIVAVGGGLLIARFSSYTSYIFDANDGTFKSSIYIGSVYAPYQYKFMTDTSVAILFNGYGVKRYDLTDPANPVADSGYVSGPSATFQVGADATNLYWGEGVRVYGANIVGGQSGFLNKSVSSLLKTIEKVDYYNGYVYALGEHADYTNGQRRIVCVNATTSAIESSTGPLGTGSGYVLVVNNGIVASGRPNGGSNILLFNAVTLTGRPSLNAPSSDWGKMMITDTGKIIVPIANSVYTYDQSTLSLVDTWTVPYSVSEAAYSNNKLYLSSFATSPDTVTVYSTNQPPNAPTITSLTGNQAINKDATNRGTWNFSDPDPGDTQSNAEVRYRVVGAATWTTVITNSPNQYYDFAAGTFAVGDYEWQVRTYDANNVVGPWTASSFFSAATAPGAPTINDPVNNGTVGTQNYVVAWSDTGKTSYQVVVSDTNDVVFYDSGEVVQATTQTHSVPFPDNGVTRRVKVRIKKDGLWSPYAVSEVTVSYTLPPAFTVSVNPIDTKGIGYTHAFEIYATHPAPAAGEPSVTYQEIYIREQGETDEGFLVAGNYPPAQNYYYYSVASGVVYEVRIRAFGDNDTYRDSDWTVATPVNFEGVILHDPADHNGTFLFMPLNSQGASDTLELESKTLAYQGRGFPTAEFGDAMERTISVSLVQAMNGESDKARNLMLRRSVLCYRDGAGRKAFVIFPSHSENDAFYGKDTKFDFTVVDFSEA